MPEEAQGEVSESSLDPHLESRLSPEAIANLDEMNARVFGGEPSEEGDTTTQPPAPGAPAAPAPVAPKPTSDKPPVTAVAPDADLPPDDGVPPSVLEPPPAKAEFPDVKDLFPDDEIGKLRTEKARANVTGMREHYVQAVKTVSELRQENANLKKQVGEPGAEVKAQIEDLLRRNTELNALVERSAARDHPWLKENVDKPRAREILKGEKALEYARLPKEDLQKALAMPEGADRIAAFDAIYDLIESQTLRDNLSKSVREIERLDDVRTSWLADREGNSAKIAAEEKVRQAEQLKQHETFIRQAIDRTADYLSEKSPFFRKSGGKPGYEKWDQQFDEDKAFVEEISLRNEDPLKLLGLVYAGVRSSRIMAAYDARGRIIADLRKQLGDRSGARPNLNGDTVDSNAGDRPLSQVEGDLISAGRVAIQQASQRQ